MKTPTTYRKNVALIVINDQGKILACERADIKGAWQLPQGGVDEGEDLKQAALRELDEEIGTKDVQIIGQYPGSIRYEWTEQSYTKGHRGQEQYYFLVRLASKAIIDFEKHSRLADSRLADHVVEFSKAEWLTAAEFVSRISGFKSEAYKQAIEKLIQMYPGYIKEK